MTETSQAIRKTTQHLIPATKPSPQANSYDIYPAHSLPDGTIESGYEALARHLADKPIITLDGYIGVRWEQIRERLEAEFAELNFTCRWYRMADCLRSETKIERLVAPFLGGDDPLFGKRFLGNLSDFYDIDSLPAQPSAMPGEVNIFYGCGAALAGWDGFSVYIDLPKNEIQFRSRAGCVENLGYRGAAAPKPQYKRLYFVDWPVLNRHKATYAKKFDLIVDGQREDHPTFMEGHRWRQAMSEMARSYIRVRPWFEPGPWGGQWIREKIPGLNKDVPNYAWSFELISPENGILFESSEILFECAFDWLMIVEGSAILGDFAGIFKDEFPIRFDFLDTFSGGNLSLQCHPRPQFIHDQFGERFTQDETYYILDCAPNAKVYLGFQDGTESAEFKTALQQSATDGTKLDVDRYVQSHQAERGDLFLIPSGTIHCSGIDNLVLEISATPYIFTFKVYDWLRMDLDGKPRPLNIDRAMANLDFDRKGSLISKQFISSPSTIHEESGIKIEHLPTHANHFYDVKRVSFSRRVELKTEGSPLVLSLVEGDSIDVELSNGGRRSVSFAETFVIPAAAGNIWLLPAESHESKVVVCFLKRDYPWEGNVF